MTEPTQAALVASEPGRTHADCPRTTLHQHGAYCDSHHAVLWGDVPPPDEQPKARP